MEDAFQASILESPDDDALRLIYADWLDEHGQPKRAEFIRVQCQLAQLDPGITPLRDYARWAGDTHRGHDHTDLLLWLCELAEQDEQAPLRKNSVNGSGTCLRSFPQRGPSRFG
jgi:uncharacterized protein (TIGR02996 family)